MTFDYSKLKGKIVEKCGTQKKFAEKNALLRKNIDIETVK